MLGRFGDADASFRRGLDLEVRNGHEALAVRTRTWWAEMLSARGARADRRSADELRSAAKEAADRLGLRVRR